MKISQTGLRLVKNFEGLRLVAYLDAVGIPTIGYGHTGSDVFIGQTITEAQAEALLRQDIAKFERGVSVAVTVPLTESQFDALVSFSFNCGLDAFRNSTLLRKLNARDYEGAANEFPRWTKAGGRELLGLVRRRAAEVQLFRLVSNELSVKVNGQLLPSEAVLVKEDGRVFVHIRSFADALGLLTSWDAASRTVTIGE